MDRKTLSTRKRKSWGSKKPREVAFLKNPYPKALFLVALLLSGLGLFFVFEASVAESFNTFGHQYHFLQRQAIGFVVGLIALGVGFFMKPSFWRRISPIGYLIGLFFLIGVFIPGISLELNGAHRWLSFGGLRLQPVELFKFMLLAFFASWMSRTQKVATFLFFTGIPALLIISQPDLGSVLVLVWIAFGLYFLAGGELKMISMLGIIGGVLVAVAILTSPYRLERLKTYLNPDLDPLGSGFHTRQITIALGNGGWFGVGLGNSRQKHAYIPEASSDSIFAIVAEEVGYVGSMFILSLYLLYFHFARKIIGVLKKGSFEFLLAWGILLWISGQTLLNLAAVVVLVPLTGLPLPFFSYGSSSLVMVLFSTGILMKLGKVGGQNT